MTASGKLALRRALFVAGILLAWRGLFALQVLDDALLPDPIDVAVTLGQLLVDPLAWQAAFLTIIGAVLGVLIGTAFGVPIGLLIGRVQWLYLSTRFIVDFGRSFPVVALLPVMILLMGAEFDMKLAVVSLASFWPIVVQTSYGSRRLDSVISDTARSYRIPRTQRLLRIILPTALPYISTGIRISLALAIVGSIAVEVLARVPGIGSEIAKAQLDGAAALAFAWIAIAGCIGMALNAGSVAVDKRLLQWHYRGPTS